MKYLVTGATGFIGRQLCQQLAAGGDTVIGLSKNGDQLAHGMPTQALDLAEEDPSAELLDGVDCFFHLAGIAHQKAPHTDYQAVNYRATVRLAHLAATAGIKTFVFISSVKAMGPSMSSQVRAEHDCTMPDDAYGLSKWQAESALREQFCTSAMSVIILRPALVCGTKVKGNMSALAKSIRLGLPRPPVGGVRSLIALDDLTALLRVVAKWRSPGVQTWIACSHQRFSTRALYDLLREAAGLDEGVSWVPRWAWRAGAAIVDIVAQQSIDITYNKLFGAEIYSNAAVVENTGWHPNANMEDIIRDIAKTEIVRAC